MINNFDEPGTGERVHAEQRKRFWLILGWLALFGAIVGFAAGLFGAYEDRIDFASPTGIAAIAVLTLLYLGIAVFGSWRFFRSVDELELADNLWASLFGFYTYALIFPAWWVAGRLESIPEPDQWVLYLASVGVATVTYFFRKWQLR